MELFKVLFLTAYGWIPERPKGADCKSVAIASKVRILLRPANEDKRCVCPFLFSVANAHSGCDLAVEWKNIVLHYNVEKL